MKIKITSAAVLAAIILPGCVAQPAKTTYFDNRYEYNPELSYANNVMHASGAVTIKDAKSKSRSPITRSDGISAAGITLGTALDAFADPASIGFNAAGFMNIAFWLTQPSVPESGNLLISWTDPASDGGYIQNLQEEGTKSIQSALANSTDRGFQPFVLNDSNTMISGVKLEDETCGDGKFRVKFPECFIGFYYSKRNGWESHSGRFFGRMEMPSPSFVEQSQSSVMYKFGMVDNMFTFNGQPRFKDIDMLAIYEKVSKTLPEHAYIYLAPGKYTFTDEKNGIVKGQVPVLLHKGKVHLFATYQG